MSRYRKKMSRQGSRKNFRRGAVRVHRKNLAPSKGSGVSRGGTRL